MLTPLTEVVSVSVLAQGLQHPSLVEPLDGRWMEAVVPHESLQPTTAESSREPLDDGSDRLLITVAGAAGIVASFRARADMRFWGFGERSDEVTRTAGTVENWVGEGPYQIDEYPVVSAITPRWALRQRRDATYYPVPWFMCSEGFGVLIENAELSWFQLPGAGASWSAGTLSERLSLRFFFGSPTELLCQFTDATGRQPYPAEAWFFGPWVQTGHDDLVPFEREQAIVARLQAARAPVSAIETHMRRLPGGAHEGRRADERRRTRLFHDAGLASLTYINPLLSEDYERRFRPAAESGALQRRADGSAYVYPAYLGGRTPPLAIEGQLDLPSPAAQALLDEVVREAVEDGHDGWMEDFGEYTPPDAACSQGIGTSVHNVYPVAYHSAAAKAAAAAADRPLARFARSGWTGAAPHVPLVWGGDPTTSWGFDGLRSALVQGLSAGLSGVALWGSDIGGFFSLGEQVLDQELLVRWIQLSAVSPLMRTKAEGVAFPARPRPQVWDDGVIEHWKRWAGFHTALSPYLLGAAAQYVEEGLPLMRHHCLAHPGDAVASGLDDQFMLGDWLLVAPVLEPEARVRKLYLPAGWWVELATGKWIAGGRWTEVEAPLAEIPIFAAEGAILPMLPEDVLSLFVQPARSALQVTVFPGGASRVRVGAEGSIRSELRGNRWSLRVARLKFEEVHVTVRLRDRAGPLRARMRGLDSDLSIDLRSNS